MKRIILYPFRFAAILSILISLNLAGCATSKILSATFEESAAVVRAWGEACIKGNFDKADTKVSIQANGDQEVCQYLANHIHNLEINSIEDRGSLINSGELTVFVEDTSSGEYFTIEVRLANSERGPVIYYVYCSSCR